jgi:hypothetical protein
MEKTARAWVAFAAVLLLLPAAAAAQTVYKLIDPSGKVTYSEEAPKNFDGKVIRIDIDPNANRATLNPRDDRDRGRPEARELRLKRQQEAQAARSTKLEDARARVTAAQQALDDARENPGPDDVRRVGNAGGGTRPVPTDQYQQRLAELEKALKEAKDDLRKLEPAD